MKTIINYFFITLCALLMLQPATAQRQGSSQPASRPAGGQNTRPATQQPARQPAQNTRPTQQQPSRPRVQQPSRPAPNNRPNAQRPNAPAPPPRPVPVRRPMPSPWIYHHRPFVHHHWGPFWRPVGFFTPRLTITAVPIRVHNTVYFYDNGVFFVQQPGGFMVVPAPVGAHVAMLPVERTVIVVNNTPHYYFGGSYFVHTGMNYQVVAPPVGAVVTDVPQGTVQQEIDGQIYLVHDGVYYMPISYEDEDAYMVMEME